VSAGGLGIIRPTCPQPCPVISGLSRGGLSSKVGFRPMPQGSSEELLSGDLFFRTPAAVFFCGPPDGFCVGSAPFTFTGVMSRYVRGMIRIIEKNYFAAADFNVAPVVVMGLIGPVLFGAAIVDPFSGTTAGVAAGLTPGRSHCRRPFSRGGGLVVRLRG
jgi:hypothetical protein